MKLSKSIAVIVLASAVAVQAFAGDKLPKELQSAMDKMVAAFKKCDAKAALACFAPDAKVTMEGQTMTAKQFAEGAKQWFAMTKSIDAKFSDLKVKVNGDTISVDSAYTFSYTAPDMKGKPGKYVSTGRTIDTWVKKKGVWSISEMKETAPSKMTLNGKPYMPPQMGKTEKGK